MERTLSHAQARQFYDGFGARQDQQSVYEDPPNHDLADHLDLPSARDVLEFGSGTGRFAEYLLSCGLPAEVHYRALDQSRAMVDLARARLSRFGENVQVEQTQGGMRLPCPDASQDRVVATYVLDLLSRDDIATLVYEMGRVLRPGGRVGVTGLVPGRAPWARCVTALWRGIHRWNPMRVGGCRPLELAPLFAPSIWEALYESRHSWRGLTSGVLVLRRK